MGKKATHRVQKSGKGKREVKEMDVKSRTTIINLHRRMYKCTFKKKAPTAVKSIKEEARRTMFTKDVRLDPTLNQHLWRNGIRNLDRKVEVVFERKKNEDEESKNKFYTLCRLA